MTEAYNDAPKTWVSLRFWSIFCFFVWWDGQNVVFLQMQLVLHSLVTERRGAKMGMQCKSATIPVAVSSFLVQPTVSLDKQVLAKQDFVDVWEDRAVTRTKSEDLPSLCINHQMPTGLWALKNTRMNVAW